MMMEVIADDADMDMDFSSFCSDTIDDQPHPVDPADLIVTIEENNELCGIEVGEWDVDTCQHPPLEPPHPPVEQMCAENGVSYDEAQTACEPEREKGEGMFEGCVEDCCVFGDLSKCVAGAEDFDDLVDDEARSSCPCTDPIAFTLNTPQFNNLGEAGPDQGSPEGILYPDAAVIDGRVVNVHIQATSEYQGKTTMNGVKGELGRLNLRTGSALSFTVAVMDKESGTAINVGELPFTWLDLDEGNRGSGRSTVQSCGAEQFASGSTELTLSEGNGCSSATSSTKGTASDNPSSVSGALMDDVAKRRVVSYMASPNDENKYEFSITVGNGHKYRNFLFSLNTGMACIDENIPDACQTALDQEG